MSLDTKKVSIFFSAIFVVFMLLLFGGSFYFDSKEPACDPINPQDIGITLKSVDIGSVPIENETCHIIEVYQHMCYADIDYSYTCKGKKLICSDKVLSRITKCPSGTVTNTIIHTGGKFDHEEVK